MRSTDRWMAAAVLVAGLSLVGVATASAGEVSVYDWPDEDVPVVIENDTGLFMIGGEQQQPLRALSWNQNDGEHDQPARLVDMSGDGIPQIVGSGTPTFMADATGIPMESFEDGCRQVFVADLLGVAKLDLICVQTNGIQVVTGEGQLGPSIDPGRTLDWCRAGDLTNDTRNDLECKYAGRNQFLRLQYDGDVFDVLESSADQARLEGTEETIDEFVPVDEPVWTGQRSFDLDGDGQAGETLHFEGDAIEIRKDGEDEPVATIDVQGTPQAAVVEDLNGDGNHEIVAVTDRRIYIIGDSGDDVADFSADAGQYNRQPNAEYYRLNVNGFGDRNDEVRELVKGVQDDIASCYGSRLRTAPFAGSGRHVVRVMTDANGAVDQLQERSSNVGDDTIQSCVNDALEGLNYPAADDGRGMVNLNVVFTFVDEEG